MDVVSPARFNKDLQDEGVFAVDTNGNGVVDSADTFLKTENGVISQVPAAQITPVAAAAGIEIGLFGFPFSARNTTAFLGGIAL